MSDQEQKQETTSVGIEFPMEQARVRELLAFYNSIGPAGRFGATMIENVLRAADVAAMSGDVVQILLAFQALKDCQ